MIILWKLYAWLLYRDNIRRPYYDIYRNIRTSYLIKREKDIRLLHVGCGVRTFEEFISDRSYITTHSHDFHRRLIFSRKVRCIDENHYSMDLERGFTEYMRERFDVVFMENTFTGIKHPHLHLEDMRRVTKDGGKLVAIVASKPSPWLIRILRWVLNIGQIPYYTRDELRLLFNTEQISLHNQGAHWLVSVTVQHHLQSKSLPPSSIRPMDHKLLCA